MLCMRIFKFHLQKQGSSQASDHQMGSAFYNLLVHGLYAGCQHPSPMPLHALSAALADIPQKQQQPSWTHLYYG